jgi:hypothetical protein
LLVGVAVILVALVVLLLATGHRAGENWNHALLTAINAVIVSLAAMGAYEVTFRKFESGN